MSANLLFAMERILVGLMKLLPKNKPNSIPLIAAPAHFEPKPQPLPMIWHLFRAERVSRDISQGVAAMELGIKLAELTDITARLADALAILDTLDADVVTALAERAGRLADIATTAARGRR